MDRVLKDINAEPSYAHLAVRREVFLRNLVPDRDELPDALRAFVGTTARVDFVVVNRLTRRPVLAVEVDGHAFHGADGAQLEQDTKKDAVLEHLDLPILRMATTGDSEYGRLREAITRADDLPLDSSTARPLDDGESDDAVSGR